MSFKFFETLVKLSIFSQHDLDDMWGELDDICERFMCSLDNIGLTDPNGGPDFIDHTSVLELHV